MVLGHESSGIVTKVGSAVTSVAAGDRVAMEPGIPCYHCPNCKSGAYNLCPEMKFASTPPFDGTLAKYYVLPSDFCYKLPDHVSLEAGALVEPTAVAVHAVRQGAVKPSDRVVVFGAGPVGLLCAGVARGFGAREVVVVDIQEERLKFASGWVAGGCQTFVPEKVPAAETADKFKKQFGWANGADVVLEVTGAEPCMQAGIAICNKGGTCVQTGMGKEMVTFPMISACIGEITIKGSFRYNEGDYRIALDLIDRGVLDVDKLISARFGFKEAEKAFEEVKAGRGIKTLIEGWKDD